MIISDAAVSGAHAQIVRRGSQYVLVDLQSKNGTFVNGEQIAQRVLYDGDSIRLGKTDLVFRTGIRNPRVR